MTPYAEALSPSHLFLLRIHGINLGSKRSAARYEIMELVKSYSYLRQAVFITKKLVFSGV